MFFLYKQRAAGEHIFAILSRFPRICGMHNEMSYGGAQWTSIAQRFPPPLGPMSGSQKSLSCDPITVKRMLLVQGNITCHKIFLGRFGPQNEKLEPDYIRFGGGGNSDFKISLAFFE